MAIDNEGIDWSPGVDSWSCGTYQGDLHSRARHHSSKHPFSPTKSGDSIRKMENQSAERSPIVAQARSETHKCACVDVPP